MRVAPDIEVSQGEWLINLDNWVIPDGNYDDFTVGQRCRFALSFWGKPLRRTAAGIPIAQLGNDHKYDVRADVIHRSDDVTVIDFGLLAYTDRDLVPGNSSAVEGQVWLSVDPFFYFEQFAKRPEVPPAIYTWTITAIWLESGPWRAVRRGLLRRVAYYEMDRTGLSYVSIGSTNEPSHATGGNFLMRCRLENVPPTRRLEEPNAE